MALQTASVARRGGGIVVRRRPEIMAWGKICLALVLVLAAASVCVAGDGDLDGSRSVRSALLGSDRSHGRWEEDVFSFLCFTLFVSNCARQLASQSSSIRLPLPSLGDVFPFHFWFTLSVLHRARQLARSLASRSSPSIRFPLCRRGRVRVSSSPVLFYRSAS